MQCSTPTNRFYPLLAPWEIVSYTHQCWRFVSFGHVSLLNRHVTFTTTQSEKPWAVANPSCTRRPGWAKSWGFHSCNWAGSWRRSPRCTQRFQVIAVQPSTLHVGRRQICWVYLGFFADYILLILISYLALLFDISFGRELAHLLGMGRVGFECLCMFKNKYTYT